MSGPGVSDPIQETRTVSGTGYDRGYKVILHNDDYTTFDFVTVILMRIFGKSMEEAQVITLKVHQEGRGVAGMYTKQIAEAKVDAVHKAARAADFPLFASYEE